MRSSLQVFLDTETTGIDPQAGHRIIELGATVVRDGMHTAEEFHQLLNPQRAIDEAATEVHGYTQSDLADQPRFAEIADDFVEFVRGREILIHNAAFDVPFLDSEFERAGRPERMNNLCQIIDTMVLAKQLHKNGQVNLNALCNKYSVDRSDRDKHGALLDSQLLAEVYLRMQESKNSLLGDIEEPEDLFEEPRFLELARTNARVVRATSEELAAHQAYLSMLANRD